MMIMNMIMEVGTMAYIVTGRRIVNGGHGPLGSSVGWVDSLSVKMTEGVDMARRYETEGSAIRALEAANREYKGISWQVEQVQ